MKPLASIYPVMHKYDVTCTPDEFQRTLNLVFHRAESRVYDTVHDDMWESLPQQFHLLISDYLETGDNFGENLVLLDVGCGTGLASDLLFKTQVGEQISEVDLLDTSPEMLQRVQERARNWRAKTNVMNGSIETLVNDQRKYDIIIVCSVLHHIPDLLEFVRCIRALQAPSGIFMHLQDPNGDYLGDPVLKQRTAELGTYIRPILPKWLRRVSPDRVISRLSRKLTCQPGNDYIRQVNEELVAKGVIRKAMTAQDMWTVTDIHVHDGRGVSIRELSRLLDNYRLISTRSYSFFGRMCSELPAAFKHWEQELIEKRAPNGLEVAGIWQVMN